ncbi:MAG: hypothetical protein PHV24_00445 [Candidatus Kapabacteria bacterium]|nr:hypothetical protein [Candidatus Kapabacteria bacterium]
MKLFYILNILLLAIGLSSCNVCDGDCDGTGERTVPEIIFLSKSFDGPKTTLYGIYADGSNLEMLFDSVACVSNFSRSGNILVLKELGSYRILVSLDLKNLERTTIPSLSIELDDVKFLDLSYDGRFALLASDSHAEIVNLSDLSVSSLKSISLSKCEPTFSSAGSILAYASDSEIFIYDCNTGKTQTHPLGDLLSQSAFAPGRIRFSPDGKSIFLAVMQSGISKIAKFSMSDFSIETSDLGELSAFNPAVSAGSNYLAFNDLEGNIRYVAQPVGTQSESGFIYNCLPDNFCSDYAFNAAGKFAYIVRAGGESGGNLYSADLHTFISQYLFSNVVSFRWYLR